MIKNDIQKAQSYDFLVGYSTNMIAHALYRLTKAIRPLVYLWCEASGSDILFDKGFMHSLDVLERTFQPKHEPSNGRFMNK